MWKTPPPEIMVKVKAHVFLYFLHLVLTPPPPSIVDVCGYICEFIGCVNATSTNCVISHLYQL